MMYITNPLRPGMTAIAAVLALSSTPLLAQSAEVSPAAPAQAAIVAPPAADVPVIATPPSTQEAASAPNAAALNIPHIAINMDDAPKATTTKPEASSATAAVKTKVAKTAPVAAPAPAPVERAVVPIAEDTIAAVPMTPAQPPAQPVVNPAPVVKPQPVTKAQPADDMLPIAGAIGLGALALGGAFAFGRRKRRDEEVEFATETTAEPAVHDEMLLTEPAPIYASRVAVPTAATDAPVTAVPAGFDLSRYGPHVQAAYRGPTEANPFLSLRNRLKRARFFDQRERMAMAPASAPTQARSEAAARAPAIAERRTDYIVSRPSNRAQPGFRPAYQS